MATRGAIPLLLLLAMAMAMAASAAPINITKELEADPNFSEFNDVLTKSGIAKDINSRSSITVCALTNAQMDALRAGMQGANQDKQLADVVRVQVFLTFVNPSDPNTQKSINGSQQMTSLYQTTGKAPGEDGIANLTVTHTGALAIVMSGTNTTITKSVKRIAYNLSIVEVDTPLKPTGVLALAPSPAPPPGFVPAPAPAEDAPAPAPLSPVASPPASGPSADANSPAGAAGTAADTSEKSAAPPRTRHVIAAAAAAVVSPLLFLLC